MSSDRAGWFGSIAVLAVLASACGSGAVPSAHVSSNPASATRSTSPSPSVGIAANLTCRLPVVSAAGPGEPPGGWVTFPGGQFVRDPASLSVRGDANLPSYDRAIGAWVPVELEKVSPDGGSYVLTSYNSTPPLYLVDAKTGSRELILPADREGPILGSVWKVIQYANEGIYLWTGNGGMEMPVPGLWLLDPKTGVVKLVDGSHYWGKVSGGFAWALDEAGTRASASKVYRLDLSTGQVSTLYESKTDIALLSPTPDGEILIDYGQIGSPRLALLAGAGAFVPVDTPPAFPPVFSARPAPQGVWIAVYGELWSGIALYVKGQGVTIMARSSYALEAAGACT
jgi:hypothetical protein